MDHMIAHVADALEELALSLLIPAWRDEVAAEHDGHVRIVGGSDLVLERELSERLRAVCDGPILSESTLSQDSSKLREVSSAATAWIINPVDPVRHFIEGSDTFSSSICLIRNGQPDAAWIFFPARRMMLTAGTDGCLLDDARVTVRPAPMWWRTTVHDDHLPASIQDILRRSRTANFEVRTAVSTNLSVLRLLDASADAHLTSMIAPWNVAAAICAWRRAGGVVRRTDTASWTACDTQGTLIFAPDEAAWEELHQRMLNGYTGRTGSSIGQRHDT